MRKFSDFLITTGIIVMVVLASIHYLSIVSLTNEVQFDIVSLKHEMTIVQEKSRDVESQIRRIMDLSHIEDVARNELGMVYADEVSSVVIRSAKLSKQASR